MNVLILNQFDIAQLLPMRECIDVMADALTALSRGDAILPLRQVLRLPDGKSAFAAMPAYVGAPKAIGAKVITVFPDNHGTRFDSHQGAVLLFEAERGSLVAIMDASSITAIRTAAVSGLATRLLTREDATDLAILGTGVQARTHLEAICGPRVRDSRIAASRSSGRAGLQCARRRGGSDDRLHGHVVPGTGPRRQMVGRGRTRQRRRGLAAFRA
jgi:ornithine cyclodeaminase